jgi:RHS repeat-associated protein
VWRGPQGGTTELVLETDAATILGSAAMMLETRLCTASFDNVQFITNDPATQTMAYNGANELTSSVVGAITTTYTYDQHGRTISKADGTHSARYIWFAGDKLKQYESDFPGEEDVAFQYDGLGKRRLKLVNLSAPTDADYTWYRWDADWNMIGEYAAGAGAGTWDLGTLTRWHAFEKFSISGTSLGSSDGTPSGANFTYFVRNHLTTVVSGYDDIRIVGKTHYSPFGQPTLQVGDLEPQFATHVYDHATNSYLSPYRHLNVSTSRWLTRDPMGITEGPNFYLYANAQPINMIDPLGLWTVKGEVCYAVLRATCEARRIIRAAIVDFICETARAICTIRPSIEGVRRCMDRVNRSCNAQECVTERQYYYCRKMADCWCRGNECDTCIPNPKDCFKEHGADEPGGLW